MTIANGVSYLSGDFAQAYCTWCRLLPGRCSKTRTHSHDRRKQLEVVCVACRLTEPNLVSDPKRQNTAGSLNTRRKIDSQTDVVQDLGADRILLTVGRNDNCLTQP